MCHHDDSPWMSNTQITSLTLKETLLSRSISVLSARAVIEKVVQHQRSDEPRYQTWKVITPTVCAGY